METAPLFKKACLAYMTYIVKPSWGRELYLNGIVLVLHLVLVSKVLLQ